jgi:hypothetical protein
LVDQIKVSQGLFEQLEADQPGYISFCILLKDQVDVRSLDAGFYKQNYTLEQRVSTLIPILKQKANQTQPAIIDFLKQTPGVLTGSIQRFWIGNLIFVTARPEVITALSHRADIERMELDLGGQVAAPTPPNPAPRKMGNLEPGIAAVNAPALWKLGYTGYGRKSLVIDTGTDPNHPALSRQYWGNYAPESQAWFDYLDSTSSANDCFFHGTHVTGTVVGMAAEDEDTIGVAYEGLWMATPAICDSGMADDVASLQWALDPDGDPNTISDMPDVINNSWYGLQVFDSCGTNPYVSVFNALEAAGVAVVFAGGNFGPGASTIAPPQTYVGDVVNTFTVGAVDGSDPGLSITSFSSRGPSECPVTGSLQIRPEVVAPGDLVRSAFPGGSYISTSGTSMAAPHVAGAVLLLKQAFPHLTGTQIKLALYYSAVDLGDPGEDNTYGNGIIDVLAAYNYLLNQGHTAASPFADYDLEALSLSDEKTIFCAGEQIGARLEVKNVGLLPVSSFEVVYSYGTGTEDTLFWTGNLAVDSSITISIPSANLAAGDYLLHANVIQPNQTEDVRFLNNFKTLSFKVVDDPRLSPTSDSICTGANALLTVPGTYTWDILWFEAEQGGFPTFNGNRFLTPEVSGSQNFYVNIGQTDEAGLSLDSSQQGRYENLDKGYLLFDALETFTLSSVKIYAESFVAKNIEVKDSADNLLHSKLAFLNPGENEVELDFHVQAAKNLKLSFSGTGALYEQTSNVNYPYEKEWVRISGSSSGDSIYSFFFDWKIYREGTCPRAPAAVTTLPGGMFTNFSATPDSVKLPNQSGEVIFQDQSAAASAWFWDFGDSTTSNDQNPTHTYTKTGSYMVSLRAVGQIGCADSHVDTVVVTGWNTGVDQPLLARNSFSLYPNPGTGLFYLTTNLEQKNIAKVRVYDLSGRVVYQRAPQTPLNDLLELDLSALANGIYYLSVEMEQGIWSQKLVKSGL